MSSHASQPVNDTHEVQKASTTEGLPVSPSMGPAMAVANVPVRAALVDRRVAFISLLAIVLALLAACVAQILMGMIGLITNLSFHGRWSFEMTSPADNHLGL